MAADVELLRHEGVISKSPGVESQTTDIETSVSFQPPIEAIIQSTETTKTEILPRSVPTLDPQSDTVPLKRRRGLSPSSMRELLKPQPGSYYCVAKSAITKPNIRPSEDLMTRIGLNNIAHSVARTDLITGRGRGLRKSYRDQAATLSLPGLLNPVGHTEGTPGSLMDLWHMPKDYWEDMFVRGKDVKDGLPPDLAGGLDRALAMENNPSALVGHDVRWLDLENGEPKGKRGSVEQSAPKRPTLSTTTTGLSANSLKLPGSGVSKSAENGHAGEAHRPRRVGKKRRYNDESFEGYGEGFVDDDGQSVSSLGADEKRKKRRKTEDSIRSPAIERRDSLLSPRNGITGTAQV